MKFIHWKFVRTQRVMLSIICVIFISSFMFSCMDCFHVATCIVVDKETNKPIDSATVEAFLVNESESVFVEMKYTDKTGLFDVGTGPLTKRGCSKDFMILISKKGYKNIVLNEPMRDTIRLEPNNFLRDRYERVWKKR